MRTIGVVGLFFGEMSLLFFQPEGNEDASNADKKQRIQVRVIGETTMLSLLAA